MLLNKTQAQELARFFFDIAKGLVLGGLGLSVVIPLNLKLLTITLTIVLVYVCIRFGLSLLEDIR